MNQNPPSSETPNPTSAAPARPVRVAVLALLLLALAGGVAYLTMRTTPTPPPGAAPAGAAAAGAPQPRHLEKQVLREPAVAGQFYPASPAALRAEVDRLLGLAPGVGLRGTRGLIAPHAGYVFSGSTAAAAYRELPAGFRRVFLLADNHSAEARYRGVSLPLDYTHFGVPGGFVPLDAAVDELAASADLFQNVPEAHASHILEVHLPFLLARAGWPELAPFTVVPMVLCGLDEARCAALARLLARYDDGSTLFLASTDLSHYQRDSRARELDGRTVEAFLAEDPAQLAPGSCCGPGAVSTLLHLAALRGWESTYLGYRNSGDASGDRSRVVGYAAVAFTEPLQFRPEEEAVLLAAARRAAEAQVREGQAPPPEEALLQAHPLLRAPRGVFVTLKKGGQLRGCIGQTLPRTSLAEGIRHCAVAAATQDHRFSPVRPEELPELSYSVSVLTYPVRLSARPEEFAQRLRPGVDGVILKVGEKESLFLPEVWEQLPDPEQFLAHLCRKQGSPPDAWRSPAAALFLFRAAVAHEP